MISDIYEIEKKEDEKSYNNKEFLKKENKKGKKNIYETWKDGVAMADNKKKKTANDESFDTTSYIESEIERIAEEESEIIDRKNVDKIDKKPMDKKDSEKDGNKEVKNGNKKEKKSRKKRNRKDIKKDIKKDLKKDSKKDNKKDSKKDNKKEKKNHGHQKDEFVSSGKLPVFDERAKNIKECYDNRELSWLKFNDRVLEEALDRDNPLMERLTFIDIFRTNLDEFYRVRVGTLLDRTTVTKEKDKKDNKTGLTPKQQLEKIFERTYSLLKKRDDAYKKLVNEVSDYGITIRSMDSVSIQGEIYLKRIFDAKIRPILSPQIVGKKQPFPFLIHGEIYVVALLESKNSKGGEKLCIIPCTSNHYRRLESISSQEKTYITAEDIILHFLPEIFDKYIVKSKAIIRLIRNADIDVDDVIHVVTLSTCSYDSDVRFTVSAVRIDEHEWK